jgi:molybdopterin-biosynthesis enzyme MoeA-like protein
MEVGRLLENPLRMKRGIEVAVKRGAISQIPGVPEHLSEPMLSNGCEAMPSRDCGITRG